jgi:transcriptional regulator with XRE-family HTH domain
MLRDYRKAMGWTLEQAEAKLGLSKSYLSELENGVRPWTLKAARKVEAKTRGRLKAAELLGFTERAA